jgi:hypothetical protein
LTSFFSGNILNFVESTLTISNVIFPRLEDTVHEYFHERVRLDQRLLAQEQTENKRLFPVGEDIETIILHLEIIKVCPHVDLTTRLV